MEYWSQVLSVLSLLAIILLVLAGAWVFTRWAGQNLGADFSPQAAAAASRCWTGPQWAGTRACWWSRPASDTCCWAVRLRGSPCWPS